MSRHLEGEALIDFAHGTLPAPEREQWEKHVIECARCRAEAAALVEAMGTLALSLPPIPPSPSARGRLLEAAGGRPAHAMVERLARFFDLAVAETRAFVDALADPAQWEKPPIPGLELFHLVPGPAHAGADAGFVRFQPSTPFPRHRHLGEERELMISGGMVEDNGIVVRPGDLRVRPEGSSHSFVTFPGEITVYALVLYKGVQIEGGAELTAAKG